MFCPNCGTKNDDTATSCKKCGFKLSGTSAPKFRGTMMLNSDQSVQDMVEEHRKKLEEAGQVPDAAGASGPTPPLPAVESQPPKPVLQPPRATLPKRRMGTMLGVAPQVGGFQPPEPGASLTPTPPPPEVPPASAKADAPASAADPFAGTVAFGAVSPVAPQVAAPAAAGAFAAGRTEAFAAVPPAPSAALAAGRTEAFEAPPAPTPSPEAAALPASEPAPASAAESPGLMARGRTEAFEAPPTTPVAAETRASSPSLPPAVPRKLRPLEVFLMIATCGLYGLVLWARQRKAS